MREWDDAIFVGVVARAQGNRGEVVVNAETDFPAERFRPGARLRVRRRDGSDVEVVVVRMRMHRGRPVLAIAGVDTISQAETLAGAELWADAREPVPVGADEYRYRDLIGCVVVTAAGETVGRVTAVEGERGANRLVVTGGRAEVLIPLAAEMCTVDLAARRITVRPPEGLLELNGDWR